MLMAITRDVSPAIERCELTHLARTSIDPERASIQHETYERCLRELGCAVTRIGSGAEMPDSVFVEDIAVVFDELAIVTRPGAESRRAETPAIASVLARHRPLRQIEPPGTLDGGDVLVAGRSVFVGRSTRTNDSGIHQLRAILEPYEYAVRAIDVGGCLHLKSAVTAVAESLLLVNPEWIPSGVFAPYDLLEVDPSEPFAANALRIRDAIVYPQAFPRTRARLEHRGLDVRSVDMSETAKAEGGVTCCSLILTV